MFKMRKKMFNLAYKVRFYKLAYCISPSLYMYKCFSSFGESWFKGD